MSPFPFLWAFSFFPPHRLHSPHSLILALLLTSGIHPNPGPPPPPLDPNFKFLQLNVNGLRNSHAELSDFLVNHSIKVACIQETMLNSRSIPPSFSNYAVIRKDRPTGHGGGLAILVHHSVPFMHIDSSTITANDQSLELLAIRISIGSTELDVYNIYLPPISS